ncbi:THUMP domain-containing protein 1 [Spatholobus suberectus]|nr:THUMP domain-containing protein 1 [Spatholobus suberectus]
MAPEGKSDAAAAENGKKRKRYLPHNVSVLFCYVAFAFRSFSYFVAELVLVIFFQKAVRKGSYPLRPGVQGFFITCDGGREHQASREALNILESFYEELVYGEHSTVKELPSRPLNKKITFADSDSSSSGDEDGDDDEEEEKVVQEGNEEKGDKKPKLDTSNGDNASNDGGTGEKSDPRKVDEPHTQSVDETSDNKGDTDNLKTTKGTAADLPAAKQCCKTNVPTCAFSDKVEQKSIDKLIEEEFKELGDKNKRRFVKLDSGCNGVVFVQMRKKDGDQGPKDIVHRIVTSAALTRKHMSRFILRILPIEVSCYASKEEISKAIKPLVELYFPVETQNPHKFAVLYEARANTGVDRMEIIDAVAKSVPGPHKVDLKNPDKTIVVEIARTVCLIGVIEKYKELSKYNLRQLTSRKD